MRLKMKFTLPVLLIFLITSVNAQNKVADTTRFENKLTTSQGIDIEVSDSLTDEYLDTLTISKKKVINDYSLLGIQYGVGLSQVIWNPRQKQQMVFVPYNIGITYTRYGKMFGYMPYFGFQTGLFFAQEGYRFKYNKESDYTYNVEGAESALLNVIELPVMAHLHFDFWKMKILFNLGCYAGYRLSIRRIAGESGKIEPGLEFAFKDTDRRWDYGIKGGIGFGLVFDPVEVHIEGMYKHSLSSLYEPDYANKDYYRYAYPSNIIISVGLHFQLTKRTGKTKAQLRQMAKDMVFKNDTEIVKP